MALWQAVQALSKPGPRVALLNADGANDLVPIFADFVIPAGLVATDIIEMAGLPANYVPVDMILAAEAIGTTATADIGIMSGNWGDLLDVAGAARTCGNEFAAAANLASPGIFRMTKKDAALLAPTAGDPTTTPRTTGDRSVGVKVLAGLAGLVTGAKLRMTLYVRPMIAGV